jgi:membrane protein
MPSRDELERRVRRVVRVWLEAFEEHDLLNSASAIAFQVLKSLVPMALLGIAVLGAIGRRDVWSKHVAPALKSRFDPPVFDAVNFAVNKIFAHSSGPLIAFAAFLTVWYVSGGVRAMMNGVNRIYEAEETRPFWLRWLLSLGLGVCVVVGIVGATLLVEAVPKPSGLWQVPVDFVRWVGAIVLLSLATGLIVRVAPAKTRPKKWASAGGVLVVASWIVMSIVFRVYVSSIANFKTAVGQLTVFLLLMVYVYASSIVFLVGVELDELLREDASANERGILDVVLGR